MWTSIDGGVWQQVPPEQAVFGSDGRQRMSSVTAGGPGLVAVGYDALRMQPAAWISSDGAVWERAVVDAAADGSSDLTMASVAVGGPGLVAVGADMHNGQAAVWTSP